MHWCRRVASEDVRAWAARQTARLSSCPGRQPQRPEPTRGGLKDCRPLVLVLQQSWAVLVRRAQHEDLVFGKPSAQKAVLLAPGLSSRPVSRSSQRYVSALFSLFSQWEALKAVRL